MYMSHAKSTKGAGRWGLPCLILIVTFYMLVSFNLTAVPLSWSVTPAPPTVARRVHSTPRVHTQSLIVTAWFDLESEFGDLGRNRRSRAEYSSWIASYFDRFASAPIVVYTNNASSLTPHLSSKNHQVYAMETKLADTDCFKRIHKDMVFWLPLEAQSSRARTELLTLWHCKSYWVRELIEMTSKSFHRFDPASRRWEPAPAAFHAQYYVWMDIGSLRDGKALRSASWPNPAVVRAELPLQRVVVASSGRAQLPRCRGMNYDYPRTHAASVLPIYSNITSIPYQSDFIAGAVFGGSLEAMHAFNVLYDAALRAYLAKPLEAERAASPEEGRAIVLQLYRQGSMVKRVLNDQHLMASIACVRPDLVRVVRPRADEAWYELIDFYDDGRFV